MDATGANDLVPVAQLRRIAESLGYAEQKTTNEVIIFTRPSAAKAENSAEASSSNDISRLLPSTFECYLKCGDVCTYLPHPRQKAFRLFHFGALHSPETLTEILQNPWSDLQFSYRFSDMLANPHEAVPTAPPPLLPATAIERQLAVIERELNDLRAEHQELKRRLRQIHSGAAAATGGGGGSGGYVADLADELDSQKDQKYDSDDTGFSQRHPKKSDNRDSRSVQKKQLLTARASTPDRSRLRNPSDQDSYNNYGSRAGDRSAGAPEDEHTEGGYSRRVSADRVRGNKGIWSMFFPDAQDDFARAWALKPVSLVALGRGYVVAYDDGSVTWCDICPLLESKLRQQGLMPLSTLTPASKPSSTPAVRIRYIVLGSESNFYVKFDNGRMEWCGQDSFGDALRKGVNDRRLLVEKVAFGQSGGWLVLWNDGSFESEGMPQTLMDRLRRHHKSSTTSPRTTIIDTRTSGVAPGIKDVTVGPTGEWFVIYKDHSVQADNLPDALYKSLSQIREKSGRVRSIAFGENRSWFVRYWDASK